jgi:hypothetical protein
MEGVELRVRIIKTRVKQLTCCLKSNQQWRRSRGEKVRPSKNFSEGLSGIEGLVWWHSEDRKLCKEKRQEKVSRRKKAQIKKLSKSPINKLQYDPEAFGSLVQLVHAHYVSVPNALHDLNLGGHTLRRHESVKEERTGLRRTAHTITSTSCRIKC